RARAGRTAARRFLPRPAADYTAGRPRLSPLLREERMKLIVVSLGLALVLLAAACGEAAEIKVLSTVGMQPATPELFAQFEAATDHRVVVTYGLAAVLKTKFLEGTPADVLSLTAPIIDDLAKQGTIESESTTADARSSAGLP